MFRGTSYFPGDAFFLCNSKICYIGVAMMEGVVGINRVDFPLWFCYKGEQSGWVQVLVSTK